MKEGKSAVDPLSLKIERVHNLGSAVNNGAPPSKEGDRIISSS